MPRVLIVEDEPWLADVYIQHFMAAGFAVHRAGNAQEAIESIDGGRPDVIVLDLMLPYGNGVLLLHELRSYVDLADIPVIIYSSAAGRLPRKDLSAYGVVAVFDKSTTRPGMVVRQAQEVLLA